MSQMIQAHGGSVAYEIYGSGGTPIVTLPGIGDTRASYRALGPTLAEAGHTVYAMDLRGHGGSDTTFDAYTSETIGDDVVALLEQLDLRNAVLVGNSIGAAAIVHASLRSDRIARLVLLSGFVSDPPYFALMRPMLALTFAWPWGVWAWSKYQPTLFVSPPTDADAVHSALMSNLREPGRLTSVRTMMCASKAAIEARLSEVSIPAPIAMGAADPDFPDPAAEASRQAELLGGTNTVTLIDDAGHYPQIEQPARTASAILTFMGTEAAVGA